jgi:RNA recognition motif-containing protein
MAQKLFVGGLPFSTSNEQLRALFADAGEVTSATVVTDRDTGRSRGFGFVTFDAPADAQRAMAEMDGTELDGRSIRVNQAEDKQRGGGGGGGGGRGGRGGGGRGGDRW